MSKLTNRLGCIYKALATGCFLLGLNEMKAFAQSRPDTVFIKRSSGECYHAIFIDGDRQSLNYDVLEKHTKSPFDTAFYTGNIEDMQKNNILFSKHRIHGIPLEWMPLNYFMHKYYVYLPSDGMNNNWCKISDSTLLYYAGGEMMVQAITGFKRINDHQFSIYSMDHERKPRTINIYVLDRLPGVAVFEYPEQAESTRYELRVASTAIRNFPLIVNYCLVQKQEELVVDKPDFYKLLKNPL